MYVSTHEGNPKIMVRGQKKFVAYYRVSTDKQGERGLGMAAQAACVEAFVRSHDGKILASFREVESGKRNDRPQLDAAIDRSQALGATLLIAKLDRLSRNAAFLMKLQDTDVDFVACDMPDANRLTIGIMAVMAQHEREAISTRTKDALAIVRQRVAIHGQKKHPEVKRLGNPNGARALRKNPGNGQPLAVKAILERSLARAGRLAPILRELEAEGIVSANAKARALNERQVLTPRGGKWTARSVINVRNRLEAS
jgi:DNA invertase Pin-like site-specific DNA recombinase